MEAWTIALIFVQVTWNLPSVTVGYMTTTSPATPALRLVNGRNRCEGRVEILYDGHWGTVCEDLWDIKNAEVVCRQIGCGNATAFNGSAAYGQGEGDIILDDVQCIGNELHLWECPHRGFLSNNCAHSRDVGVVCSVSQIGLRLVNGRGRCDGRVEILYNGQWGTVCDDYFDLVDAEVVCQQMGCGNALAFYNRAAFGQGQGPIILDDVQCYGNELHLWDCPHRGFLIHNCGHYSAVGVVCSGPQQDVRLVNGESHCEGRVEVLYNGQWGTVCDDNWDIKDAHVVCQQLGCGNAFAFYGSAAFGQGQGDVILNNVQCNGNERYLWECPHGGILSNNCGHDEDAGVICSAAHKSLRLVDGRDSCDGLVEILYNGQWGTVCDHNWNIIDAEVVCRQLSCGNAHVFDTKDAYQKGRGKIILGDVQGNGNELYLWDCSHRGFLSHDCGHDKDVGVVCAGPQKTLRLANGRGRCDGRVEILYNGQWGTVCDDGWNIKNAEVVCRYLGCGNALAFNDSAAYGPGQGHIILDDVLCKGNEFYLWDCPHRGFLSNNCGHHKDVGVVCSDSPTGLRLVNGSSRCDGHVEIFYDGQWGTVCDDGWNIMVAQVVCQQLGCGQGPIILDDVRCYEDHLHLWDCEHNGYLIHDCEHNKDVGVVCSGPTTTTTSTTTDFVKCGGILTNLYGEISLTSNISSQSDSCTWYISVTNGYRIHLNFRSFIMKTSQACSSSSVSVYDGTPLGSALLGDLCRSSTRDFFSSSNSISIVFSQANREPGLEFFATYYSTMANNQNGTPADEEHSAHLYTVSALHSSLASLGYSSYDLALNDPQCHPLVTSDLLEFHIPYDGCLTVKQVKNDTITYTNTLVTESNIATVIYKKKIRLNLECRLYRETVVEGMYSADDFINTPIIQYGLYFANLIFFQSSTYTLPVTEYPYYVDLNQNLYLQATLPTSDPTLVLFLDTCVASPDESDFTSSVFYIINKGCSRVPDYRAYPSPANNIVRFGFNTFSFLKKHSRVYLQCTLVVCKEGSANSRCSQGCIRRRKRSADPDHDGEVYVVGGPVELKHR
ncbi:scavenger receptor cysteine-rich domain-containing protein DMBT1 [Leptodactylus fuscus]